MKTLIPAAIRCSLMFTAVAALSVVYPASANLITNGGFETGDLTGWTLSGQGTGVSGTVSGIPPHSGNFQAFSAAPVGHALLSQNIPTTPGASYQLNIFLAIAGEPVNPFSFRQLERLDYLRVFPFNRIRLCRVWVSRDDCHQSLWTETAVRTTKRCSLPGSFWLLITSP